MSQHPVFVPTDAFAGRHLGATGEALAPLLAAIGVDSLEDLIARTVPARIRLTTPLALPPALGEAEALAVVKARAQKNRVLRSVIGQGYYGTVTPPIITRNVLENPGWYTQYTPYQAEISQGRLEGLVNFQTMVADLTGLPLTNASLLDEGTAAAEAMTLCKAVAKAKGKGFYVAEDCHPQTLAVVKTRAEPLGIEVQVGPADAFPAEGCFGLLLQYPTTDGRIEDYRALVARAHQAGALVVAATDLLALTLLTPPGEWGADVAVGSSQRFGVPMGFGGPHAAFFATRDEYRRQTAGRIVGLSRDARGRPAYRLALQTREQHIRRDKASSNICTAQVLLALMAGFYAVYHGPEGLTRIAARIYGFTDLLKKALLRLGHAVNEGPVFDTLKVRCDARTGEAVYQAAQERGINLRRYADGGLGISLDETTDFALVDDLLACFAMGAEVPFRAKDVTPEVDGVMAAAFRRKSPFLTHEVFHKYRTEHELLRYLHRLQGRDISLTRSMIPLGSCTMKLNATTEMLPISWPEFAGLHPFAPAEQAQGFAQLIAELCQYLSEITGFAAATVQPNAGSQGEYAGLMVIRAYHASRGEAHRDVCLVPNSAHGTNPASASLAGMKIVPVACNDRGDIDLADLAARAAEHAERLACIMVTYPSTHGVFEDGIVELCQIVHRHGGQVYLDGANMNAQVGLCRPGDIGADVCHLNLHKTFAIPHGGGGPGVGPIAVAKHLVDFLPGGLHGIGAVSAAPFGSALILPISYLYIRMMGPDGLAKASQHAILAANYMAARLKDDYPVLYTGAQGTVAHEFILDCRGFKATTGIEVDDIAKRLMDFGFHAPTMSFPVAGTLMIEPTESESPAELDRLVDALKVIRAEIRAIEEGRSPKDDNPLKNAPHPAEVLVADDWSHAYSREQAAYPAEWVKADKYWPPVARVDNPYGDRNLCTTCPR